MNRHDPQQTVPKFAPDGFTADVMRCPSCEGPFLHHERIMVQEGHEDEAGIAVTVDPGCRVSVRPERRDAMPGRRSSLDIEFWCEECGEGVFFTLRIGQHKGATMMFWLWDKDGPVRTRRARS